MMEEGLFSTILDVQCFDMGAVKIAHRESESGDISQPYCTSPAMKELRRDHFRRVVVLGATQIDLSLMSTCIRIPAVYHRRLWRALRHCGEAR